jgi:hypothetical protein
MPPCTRCATEGLIRSTAADSGMRCERGTNERCVRTRQWELRQSESLGFGKSGREGTQEKEQKNQGTTSTTTSAKNFGGRFSRPPFYFALSALTFSFLLTSLRPFSWLPWFLFSLSIVQSSSQRSFVAIVECIESLKNDVKEKMVDVSCSLSSTRAKKRT